MFRMILFLMVANVSTLAVEKETAWTQLFAVSYTHLTLPTKA